MEQLKTKEKLERMRDTLVDRIIRIESDKVRSEPLPQDFAEQAVAVGNDEVLDFLDEVELKELKQINMALGALKTGRYGKCSECDNQINEKRLKALPFATKCMKCV